MGKRTVAVALQRIERQNGHQRAVLAKRVIRMATPPRRVSIVAFRETDPSILFGVFDTLWGAGRLWDMLRGLPPGEPLFEPRIVGARAGLLELVTGVSIVAQDGVDDLTDADIVFVPNIVVGTAHELRALDRTLLDWLCARYAAGAQIYASCGGPLALAEAGLLKGNDATTHWGYADLFRREYPDVTLHAERILVQTGDAQRIVCSGGASSWQDLALYLVTKHVGAEEAIRLSKIFLYQWHRDGQRPYDCMLKNVTHEDALMRELQTWVAEHYARPSLVKALVHRSGLPERSFNRRFKAATGYAPVAYIQALRIEEAKHVLETSEVPVEQIGHAVGYEDSAHFRRLFKRLTGLTPSDYRRKFRLPRLVRELVHAPHDVRHRAPLTQRPTPR